MTNVTHVRSESWLSTNGSESPRIDSTVTARPSSLYLAWENISLSSLAIESEFDDIDDVIASHESRPERKDLIAAARRETALRFPDQTRGVATLRLQRGLSQRQLAELIGTSQPHIARIEAGRDDIKLETARRLAEALGVSLIEIDAAVRARRPE